MKEITNHAQPDTLVSHLPRGLAGTALFHTCVLTIPPKTLQWRSSEPHFTDGKTESEVRIVILAGGRAGIKI